MSLISSLIRCLILINNNVVYGTDRFSSDLRASAFLLATSYQISFSFSDRYQKSEIPLSQLCQGSRRLRVFRALLYQRHDESTRSVFSELGSRSRTSTLLYQPIFGLFAHLPRRHLTTRIGRL